MNTTQPHTTLSVPKLSNAEVMTYLFVSSHHPRRPSDLDRYPTIMKFLKEDKIMISAGHLQPLAGIRHAEEAFTSVVPHLINEWLHSLTSDIELLDKNGMFVDADKDPSFQFFDAMQLRIDIIKCNSTLHLRPSGRLNTTLRESNPKYEHFRTRLNEYHSKYSAALCQRNFKLAR